MLIVFFFCLRSQCEHFQLVVYYNDDKYMLYVLLSWDFFCSIACACCRIYIDVDSHGIF